MLADDSDITILRSTPFQSSQLWLQTVGSNVLLYRVRNKRCCVVLYCNVSYCTESERILDPFVNV